jgi:8-oxo-dGTP pyrophosphatase MutT (NUDIX family)
MTRFEKFDASEMSAAIARGLARSLPGRAAHRTMAHNLAYGRHHGPIPDDARRSAVILALHRTPSGWSIPALVRAASMRSHAGQVSLPGGKVEDEETAEQTALREFEEEFGVSPAGLTILGRLTPVYVFISGFEITPVIAIAATQMTFLPNPDEVAAVIELPLAQLCDPAVRGRHVIARHGLQFSVPHFAISGQQIWGATSLILAEFAALLQRAAGLIPAD